jgi:hypothetical protein
MKELKTWKNILINNIIQVFNQSYHQGFPTTGPKARAIKAAT